MNQDPEYSELTVAYQQTCRELDRLRNDASQDNASARMAFDQCKIALENAKQTAIQCLNELYRAAPQEQGHYLQAARHALQIFKELVHDAGEKVKTARPMPPFLF